MATYYVATTGNDTTGNGSTGNRWATISKALATVVAGDTVNVGTGTYAESTGGGGFFSVTQIFASDVIIQSEAGTASDVVITGASNATYNTLIQWGSVHIRWKNLTFAMRVGTNAHAIRVTEAVNHAFEGCRFITTSDAGGVRTGVALLPSGATTIDTFTFLNCIWSQTGTYAADAISMNGTVSAPIRNITFTNPNITAVRIGIAAYGTVTTMTITNGSVTSSASDAVFCAGTLTNMAATWSISGLTATGSTSCITCAFVTGLTLTDIVASGSSLGTKVTDTTTCVVTRGTYTSVSGVALELGVDGETGGAVTGSISSATIKSTSSHALLIGAGCSGVTVTDCTVHGGDHGFVVKECSGTVLTGNILFSGSLTALYFKGAIGATASGNRIVSTISGSRAVQVLAGGTGNKSGTISVTNNTIIALGAGNIFYWGSSTDDSGGSVCNNNYYLLTSTGNFGTVNGTVVTTLSTVRTAWAAYGAPTNDSTSTDLLSPVNVAY